MTRPRQASGTESRRGKLRGALDTLGQRPRKRFGQNFLADPSIARRIVDLAQLRPGEPMVEIGPGLGALTDHLVERGGELWLIEIDRGLAANLRSKYAERQNVYIVEGDALTVDFAGLLEGRGRATLVANLPYNIATPLIAELVGLPQLFGRLVVMVQREVAERLRAKPGSKAYGALSAAMQLQAEVRKGFVVGPGAFVPRPRVESEVVVIEPYGSPVAPVPSIAAFRQMAQRLFGQRRKQLGNSLRAITDSADAILRGLGIEPSRRPETLSVAELAALSCAVASSHRRLEHDEPSS